jgi:hypothetical protein
MRLSLVFAALLLVGCDEADPMVTQVGYFKSSVNDRIFTARLSGDASEEDARIFGESRPHTAGQMTVVYIYENEAVIPADGVTRANSVSEVNDVLELPNLSSWRFVYMRYRNGNFEFVDCESTTSVLCR